GAPLHRVPPASSTLPLVRRAASCPSRAVPRLLVVAVHNPVAGLKRSAVSVDRLPMAPPARSTVPSPSRVAVCQKRPFDIAPVDAKLLRFSSNTSVVSSKPPPKPPATSTLPLLSLVAVWRPRDPFRSGPADQVPAPGS